MQLWELVEMVTEEIWVWRKERTHPSPHQFLTVCTHYQGHLQEVVVQLCLTLLQPHVL